MSLKDKANSLTFDYLTTSRTDYQVYDLKATPKTVLKENKQTKPVNIEKKREPRIKHTQTLKEWQSVPFDLLIGPKPILQTNPHHIQPPFVSKLKKNTNKTHSKNLDQYTSLRSADLR